MAQERELQQLLKKFIRLLKKEKKALIKDEGTKIMEIVEEKKAFVELLSEFQSATSELSMSLIQEIQELQTDNLLLTEQTLSYQEAFLSAISASVKDVNPTYSRQGNIQGPKDISLVNQQF